MEGCYWIYIPDRMARRDCDKEIFYLKPSLVRDLPETEMLTPFLGKPCPCCGKPIMINENSYDLLNLETNNS